MPRKEFKLFPFRNNEPWREPEVPKLPVEEPDTDFKRKYPPDTQLGQELADNARVWKVYRDEATQHDDGVLSGWNNTIDILLTFAGLFSAAVTAFVVESYQFLQPAGLDLGLALYALAVNDTATLHTLATSSPRPSSNARWINGLWFTSLFFALAAAFLCILVKQWLDEYISRTRASSQNPKHWSRRRAFYFRAIDDWGVAGVISLLPLLLHAALFLFFAGMVVLLWSLNLHMAVWLSALSVLFLLLYIASLVIPVWHAACPFATPLAKHLRGIWTTVHIWILDHALPLSESAADMASWCGRLWYSQLDPEAVSSRPHLRSIQIWCHKKRLEDNAGMSLFDRLINSEHVHYDADDSPTLRLADDLDCDALYWLTFSVSDSDAHAVAFQTLGGMVPGAALDAELTRRGIYSRISGHEGPLATSGEPNPTEAARIVRSILHLDHEDLVPTATYIRDRFPDIPRYHAIIRSKQSHPDLRLLGHALYVPLPANDAFRDSDYEAIRDTGTELAGASSPSLNSTIFLLTSLKSVRRHHIMLFLLCCDLYAVSAVEWSNLLGLLRGDSGTCPRHAQPSSCNLSCYRELLAELLQVVNPPDLDPVVLTKLFDAACSLWPAHLAQLPTFMAYIASDAFFSHEHSNLALFYISDLYCNHIGSWDESDSPSPIWFKAWQYASHRLRLRQQTLNGPTQLIASALWDPMDRHVYDEALPNRRLFRIPAQRGDVVSAILCTAGNTERLIPSIWQLIASESREYYSFTVTTRELASALCTITRNGGDTDGLITAFLTPMSVVDLMAGLARLSTRYISAWSISLAICAHVMELRSSWWVEGLNHLMHEDRQLLLPPADRDSEPVTISVLQDLAVEIMGECLRRGPCYDCPLVVAPLAFDISLRTYTVNPFAVYPIVDVSDNV